jgi:hypothetical protein
MASVLFGALWMTFSPAAAFLAGASIAVAAAGLMAAVPVIIDGNAKADSRDQ